MKLLYSKTGIPYIELDNDNKLIFSSKKNNGYKWLVFSGLSTESVAISSGKGKSKKMDIVSISNRTSFITDLLLSDIKKKQREGNQFLTKNFTDGISKIIEPFIVDGLFPINKLGELSVKIEEIDKIDSEDLLEDDPMGYYEESEEDDE